MNPLMIEHIATIPLRQPQRIYTLRIPGVLVARGTRAEWVEDALATVAVMVFSAMLLAWWTVAS
jgi:hypothetical protein